MKRPASLYRFRYYFPSEGTFINQDPIGLVGNNPNLYGDVFDPNSEVDLFGLDLHHIIPQQVYKEFRTAFDSVIDYVQNVLKKADDVSNLTDLSKPFHGNHPVYNQYVKKKISAFD